jgi:hypothetical protein
MQVHTQSSGPPSTTGSDQRPADHLVCAYSPRWLSGPSHYEGLVATFSPDNADEAPGFVPGRDARTA